MIAKLLSGRFIFTVTCALVFAILSVMGKIPAEKAVEVIMVVIVFYFARSDRGQTNGGLQK